MPKKSGPNDEARERSRVLLLRAGADLLMERAVEDPFAALKLRALCTKAGLSTGAFYVHWETMDDYHAALAQYLGEEDEVVFQGDFDTLAEMARAGGEDPFACVAALAEKDLDLLVANPFWDAIELVSLTWGRERLRDELVRGNREIDRITGNLYGTAVGHLGREPRPPFNWDAIGTILQALAEGFGLRRKIDPEILSATAGKWNLYAIAATAILAALTRPVGDEDDAEQALRRLLESRRA